MNYEFEVVLAGPKVMTIELGDALVAAGCDDSTTGSCEGKAFVAFDREAGSLEEAIRSAVADIRRAGIEPAEVRLAPDSLAIA